MNAINTLRARTVVLPSANIDTDQIIPARFLTTTTREGLGRSLFADWRYDAEGALRTDFVLNRPEAQGCRILVAGGNFGCGKRWLRLGRSSTASSWIARRPWIC